MAITVTDIGGNQNQTGATITLTVPAGGIPAGSIIFVCICDLNGTTGSYNLASDSVGNNYGYGNTLGLVGTVGEGIFTWAWNTIAIPDGGTISYVPTSVGGAVITAFYATGIDTSADPQDGNFFHATALSGTGSTTPSVTALAPPATQNSLVIGVVITDGPTADVFTQDTTHAAYATPPTRVGTNSASGHKGAVINSTIAGGSVVSSSQLTYAPTLGTARNWAIAVEAFKPAPAGTAYSDSVTESGSGADSTNAGLRSSGTISEAGSASDAVSAVKITSSSVAETGSGSDSTDSAPVLSASVAEAGSASDTVSDVEITSSSVTEAGSASDTTFATGIISASVSEAVSASDAVSAVRITSSSITEAGSASDTTSATVVSAASVAEAESASDSTSTSLPVTVAVGESGSPSDSVSGIATFSTSIAETRALLDSPSVGASTWTASVSETLAAADAAAESNVETSTVSESLTASDSVSANSILRAASLEAAAASDSLSVVQLASVSVTEAADASTAENGSTLVTDTDAVSEDISVADSTNASSTSTGNVTETGVTSDSMTAAPSSYGADSSEVLRAADEVHLPVAPPPVAPKPNLMGMVGGTLLPRRRPNNQMVVKTRVKMPNDEEETLHEHRFPPRSSKPVATASAPVRISTEAPPIVEVRWIRNVTSPVRVIVDL